MSELLTLDASVLVKLLVREDQSDLARQLFRSHLEANDEIVAPSWAWAEVGSTLLKKARQGTVPAPELEELWQRFTLLPLTYVDDPPIRERAWAIATDYGLPTLYDAAFLAVTELAPGPLQRTFWTADADLIRTLRPRRPSYVRELRELI